MPEQIILIRHLEPVTEKELLLGHTDCSLTEHKNLNIDKISYPFVTPDTKIFSSDLRRAIDTAKLLFPQKTINTDPNLREINFGDYELFTWGQIEAEQPEFYQEYMRSWKTKSFPNGESLMELNRRIKRFVNVLMNQELKIAIIVAHGGSIRSLLYALTDYNLEKTMATQIGYGDILKLKKSSNQSYQIQK
ncbi:MAG: histidine phosphatase family protein [Lentisphaeria bacterium]|nr:histidine phosphatase family protein [Lentisphaeria bacterium]